MRKTFKLLPLVAALALTGCMSMAPSYERPQAPIVDAWPAGEAYAEAKLNQQALPDWHDRKRRSLTLGPQGKPMLKRNSISRLCPIGTNFSQTSVCAKSLS